MQHALPAPCVIYYCTHDNAFNTQQLPTALLSASSKADSPVRIMPWGLLLPQWIPIHQLLLKFYPHLKTACTWLACPVNAHHMTTTLPTAVEPSKQWQIK